MADVNVAIRVGGAVVEDPGLPISSNLTEPAVEIQGFPSREDGWLQHRKIRLHREGGYR